MVSVLLGPLSASFAALSFTAVYVGQPRAILLVTASLTEQVVLSNRHQWANDALLSWVDIALVLACIIGCALAFSQLTRLWHDRTVTQLSQAATRCNQSQQQSNDPSPEKPVEAAEDLTPHVHEQEVNLLQHTAAGADVTPGPSMSSDGEQNGPALSMLPEAAFADLLCRMDLEDVRSVRSVCRDWRALTSACLTTLAPRALAPKDVSRSFPHLTRLDLSNCVHGLRASYLRIALRSLTQLTELQLGCPSISSACSAWAVSDRCVAEVARQGQALKSLSLGQCAHVGDAGLMAVQSMTRLQRLDLSGCMSVTEVGILMLSQMPALTQLNLSWCLKLSDAGMKALTAAHSRLISLDISGCPLVTATGVGYLGALTRLTSLHMTHMGLATPPITDDCLVALCDLKNLSSFALGCIKAGRLEISDSTLQNLAGRHPVLSSLELHSLHKVTDAGVQHLAATLGASLTRLLLRSCVGITQACLPAVADMTGLQELEILGCTPLELTHKTLPSLLQRAPPHEDGAPQPAPSSDLDAHAAPGAAPDEALTQGGQDSSAPEPTSGADPTTAIDNRDHGNFGGAATSSSGQAAVEETGLGSTEATTSTVLAPCTRRRCDHATPASSPSTSFAAVPTLLHIRSLTLGSVYAPSVDRNQVKGIDDSCLTLLKPLGPVLRSLTLVTWAGTLDCPDAEQGLRALSCITHLELIGCRRTDDPGWRTLSAAPCAPCLRKLVLVQPGVQSTPAGLCVLLSACSRLTALTLRGSPTIDDSVAHCVSSGLTRLSELQLHGAAHLTDTGVNALQALKGLTSLMLSGCDSITGMAFRAWPHVQRPEAPGRQARASKAPLQCRLLALSLSVCTALADEAIPHMCLAAPGLSRVDLAQCSFITDSALGALATLQHLTSLDLQYCSRISDKGVAALSRLPHLATLRLTGCVWVGNDGIRALTALHSVLLTLQLDKCIRITDKGLESLAAITSLTSLRLGRCPEITDLGLTSLLRLTRLSTLNLEHCSNVTMAGLTTLTPLTAMASLSW